MAVTNNICATITSCTNLILTDTSDWDTVDTVDITNSDVVVVYDGISTTIENAGYLDEFNITPEDLGQTGDTLEDGIYHITVTYTHTDTTEYIIYKIVLNDCSIRCKLDKLVLAIADETCDDCKRKTAIEVYELLVTLHALHASIACNNIERAELLLNCITDGLANFNCKNC